MLPTLMVLEDRQLLANFFVTNTNKYGVGSLSYAINEADKTTGANIYFDMNGDIDWTGDTPEITKPMTINGYFQSKELTPKNGSHPNKLPFADDADITVGIHGGSSGLQIVNTQDVTIKGLAIYGNTNQQINIFNSSNVTVVGCFIGSNRSGEPGNNIGIGIKIDDSSTNIHIGSPDIVDRNVIGGNGHTSSSASPAGVDVTTSSNNVVITNNLIGTNKEGVLSDPNLNGVEIGGTGKKGPVNNVTVTDNLISGNTDNGVLVTNAKNVNILNNLIGGAVMKRQAYLPNGSDGVFVTKGTDIHIVGNHIAGNGLNGVHLGDNVTGEDVSGVEIKGDVIGLYADGAPGGNGLSGIAAYTDVYGSNTIAGNTITNNGYHPGDRPGAGIYVQSNNVSSNPNHAGTAFFIEGNTVAANVQGGIVASNARVAIGGTSAGAGNVVSGNIGVGIKVGQTNQADRDISYVLIQGNDIGVKKDGMTQWFNTGDGIEISQARATIGGTDPNARNIISGNNGAGVRVDTGGVALIQGNDIGVCRDGRTPIGNGQQGVYLSGAYQSTVTDNKISGNGGDGVGIDKSYGGGIQGNVIRANGGAGVRVQSSERVTIGSAASSGRNVVFKNKLVGIMIDHSHYTQVTGNFIGAHSTGTVGEGNDLGGIQVLHGSDGTTIGGTTAGAGNVISGNGGSGITVGNSNIGRQGADGGSTTIQGNLIGTDAQGKVAVQNKGDGISLFFSKHVTVGGTTSAARNVISGNGGAGVDATSFSNATIQANYIGVGSGGVTRIGNGGQGVALQDSSGGIIGGLTPTPGTAAGNVISGNGADNVSISQATTPVTVQGNLIGTDATGTDKVEGDPAGNGITIQNSTGNVTVGWSTDLQTGQRALARNVISGNKVGISISGGNGVSSNVRVAGNFIGTNITGDQAVKNTNGVWIEFGGSATIGDATGPANVISGNDASGIMVAPGAGDVSIKGNDIGTDLTTKKSVPNQIGITVANKGGSGLTLIGDLPGGGNIISGNRSDGVDVVNGNAILQGNTIGLASDGLTVVENGGYGLKLDAGGTTAVGNVISGNAKAGVVIDSGNNSVANSKIGTDAAGFLARANAIGVEIRNGIANTLWGNVIAGNHGDGVRITGGHGALLGNKIGVDATGNNYLANTGFGVDITDGGGGDVGGTASGDRNIISANTAGGVMVVTTGNQILNNFIGTNAGGTTAIANGNKDGGAGTTAGVMVAGQASNNVIDGNLISGQYFTSADGIIVGGNARGTLIRGNYIGLRAGGTGWLANLNGIVVKDSATNTTIGQSGSPNFIAFNGSSGIEVVGGPSSTIIQGNTIGLDKNGNHAGNNLDGVQIMGGSNFTIGGDVGNVISHNAHYGLEIHGNAVTGTNVIKNNMIGTDKSGMIASGNTQAGVYIADFRGGGTLNVQSNTISGNGQQGVLITDSRNVTIGGGANPGKNLIGSSVDLTRALPNGGDGVSVMNSTGINIGGTNSRAGNVITGNSGDGIHVGGNSTGTLILGNNIGSEFLGNSSGANGGNGINVSDTASGTTIGDNTTDLNNDFGMNVITGNKLNGVNVGADTTNTVLYMNYIGLYSGGTDGLGNGENGVNILGKATLAGTLAKPYNAIAANKGYGIFVSGANASGTIIQGYRIGTNAGGNAIIQNDKDGIMVAGADNVRIGSAVDPQSGNLISGNAADGISVSNSTGTMFQRNVVGTDLSSDLFRGNAQNGIELQNATNASISDNTVSSNKQNGIVVGGSSSGTKIAGNKIGTSLDGKTSLGNNSNGVLVTGTANNTTIDDNLIAANSGTGVVFDVNARNLTLTGNTISRPLAELLGKGNNLGVSLKGQQTNPQAVIKGNTITSNKTTGIDVASTARGIKILGNFIGTNKALARLSGNDGDGIVVNGLATATIGGTNAGDGNVISGNKGNGISVMNSTAGAVVDIVGNSIGVDRSGTMAIPNKKDGIQLSASTGETIQANVISGNGQIGIDVLNRSSNNTLSGNKIGVDSSGTKAIPNTMDGVQLSGSIGTQIQNNLISGNGQNGVDLLNGSSNNTLSGNKIGVAVNGTSAVPNGKYGIWVHKDAAGAVSMKNTIRTNTIGFNAKGVVIGDDPKDNSQGNAIVGNLIFRSPVLIDLGNNGGSYTPSGTTGPNLLLQTPEKLVAKLNGADLVITGSLSGTRRKTIFAIEFFSFAPKSKTTGPLSQFLGSRLVETNDLGDVDFTFKVKKPTGVQKGDTIRATATGAGNNTSGFGMTTIS
jgi:parallel beta-helix repeat protein